MTTKPMSEEKPLKFHICNDAFPGNTLLRWYVGTNLMSHDNAIKAKSDLERAIDRIEALEAENAKLKGALIKIRDCKFSEDDYTADIEDMQEVATLALKECESEND